MGTLTKAIILGTKHRRPVALKDPMTGDEYTVYVRPLSDGEAEIIQAMNAAGMQMSGTPEKGANDKGTAHTGMQVFADLEVMTAHQLRAKRRAVALALCGDDVWTEDEIAKHWPATWTDEAAKVVYRISGIDLDKSEVRQFRTLGAGPGVAAADAARDTAGDESSGAHTAPKGGPGSAD